MSVNALRFETEAGRLGGKVLVVVNPSSEPVPRNSQEGGDAGEQPVLQTGTDWELQTCSDCTINPTVNQVY